MACTHNRISPWSPTTMPTACFGGDPSQNPTQMDAFITSVARQQRIGEEIWHVGYCIVTVDGDNVTVDYYAVPVGLAVIPASGVDAPNMTVTPT